MAAELFFGDLRRSGAEVEARGARLAGGLALFVMCKMIAER